MPPFSSFTHVLLGHRALPSWACPIVCPSFTIINVFNRQMIKNAPVLIINSCSAWPSTPSSMGVSQRWAPGRGYRLYLIASVKTRASSETFAVSVAAWGFYPHYEVQFVPLYPLQLPTSDVSPCVVHHSQSSATCSTNKCQKIQQYSRFSQSVLCYARCRIQQWQLIGSINCFLVMAGYLLHFPLRLRNCCTVHLVRTMN